MNLKLANQLHEPQASKLVELNLKLANQLHEPQRSGIITQLHNNQLNLLHEFQEMKLKKQISRNEP